MPRRIWRAAAPVLALALLLPLAPAAAPGAKSAPKADKPAKKRADKAAAKKAGKVAHVKLSGGMEEQAPTVDSLLGALGETFREKLARIRKAGEDKEVVALLLEIHNLRVGWGKLHELCEAVKAVRAGGKKVFAHLQAGESKDYLLALACDEVCLSEPAWLMLTGLRMEISFYKDLLDKLDIKADMLHMGDYKGAAEPLTRTSLSEPNRKQLNALLDDAFEHEIVDRVKARKGMTAAKVKHLIDNGPYAARAALRAGLVDRLAYLDDYEEALQKQFDGAKLAREYGKKKEDEIDLAALARKFLLGPSKAGSSSRGHKVAVIYASGEIMTGKSISGLLGGETVGSDTLVKAIRQAENDKTVKAIVLRVDSPGGSALASDLIWAELKRCKKPVVASMSDVAASGGYYISMVARKIYAEPGTITGSIGVVGGKLATQGLWKKAGVKTEVLSRGAHSGLLTSDAPFTDSERKTMTALMQDTYDLFVDKALEGRRRAGKKMTRERLLSLAGGRVWTGRQAKENGLVDELGTLHDAVAWAAKAAHLPADKEPELLELPKSRGMLDSFLGEHDVSLLLRPALLKAPDLAEKLRGAGALLRLRGEPTWAVMPFHLRMK
jgi:protease-4